MFLNELTFKEKEAFVVVAKEVIEANDKIEQSEEELLNNYKNEMNLIEDDIKNSMETPKTAKIILAAMGTNKKRKVYMELYALAICDGYYDKEEKTIINEIQSLFEISNSTKIKLQLCTDELNGVYKKISDTVNE